MFKNKGAFSLFSFLISAGLLISVGEGTSMAREQTANAANWQKPRIDLASPAQTETATFALG